MEESKNTENQGLDSEGQKMKLLVFADSADDYAGDDAEIDIDDEDVEAMMEDRKDENPEVYGRMCAAKSSADKSLWGSVLGMAKDYLIKAIKKQVNKTINSATKKLTNALTGSDSKKKTSAKKSSTAKKTTAAKKSSPAKKEEKEPAWVALVKKFVQMCSTPAKKKMVSTVRISALSGEISDCLKKSRAKASLLEAILEKLEPRAASEQKTQEMPMWADLVSECRQALDSEC